MKQIIVASILAVLVMSPLVLPAPALAATASETQKDLLIQLLLEKIKVLQLELQTLLKAKESPTKVEITNQNSDYKKVVAPLIDSLEEKEDARKALMKKLEESQCVKPWRVTSKEGTTFRCRDVNPTFSPETPLADIVPLTSKSERYIKDIQTLDKEITDLNTKIKSLKTRYGISS